MDQICCQQSDLRKALLEVPRLAVGARSVSDILKTNISSCTPASLIFSFSKMLEFTKVGKVISEWPQTYEGKLLKVLNKYSNTHPPFQYDQILLSGSWSEGLTLHQIHESAESQLSDMDFMFILKNISFSEEDQTCGNLTVREDTPFVHAYITKEESLKMWKDFLEDGSKNRLSSRKLKEMLYENYKEKGGFLDEGSEYYNDIGDGPALKVSKELLNFDNSNPRYVVENALLKVKSEFLSSSDIVLSIRCAGWPRNALEWIERERVWPDQDLVQTISEDGFHIVPKSSPEGDFRLSFSAAEITLIENLTPLQHKVLRAFKAVVKYHQSNWSPKIKDIISTYHLKTIAFWHFEKSAQDSWTEDNVVSHLLSLLDEFAQALREGNLPMYFLPKYNLLGKVAYPEEMTNISGKVVQLSRDLLAITTAVNEVAHAKFIDVLLSEIFRIGCTYFHEVVKGFHEVGEEVNAMSGNERQAKEKSINLLGKRDGSIWKRIVMDVIKSFDQTEILDTRGGLFKKINEVAFSCFQSKFRKENETFISLD